MLRVFLGCFTEENTQLSPFLSRKPCTEPEIMVCTWLGELCYCSCLPVLPDPAWVLLSYVLHTFISGSVHGEAGGCGLVDLGWVD